MTPKELRAEAARARAEARRLIDYAETLDEAAKRGDGLQASSRQRIVSPVDVNQDGLSAYTKRAATRSWRELQRKLYEKNVTVAGLARELGESRSRVSSWFAAAGSAGNRPIPRSIAQKLEAKYGIPLGDWPRIDG
ncbi:MAG TPA: helix-turn-helix transcriptional regulator [Thermomicrobiaceae bacterium]|nr:helix-turn-helix transcriptional regulator [Thermomicrobiaceae bacterium]